MTPAAQPPRRRVTQKPTSARIFLVILPALLAATPTTSSAQAAPLTEAEAVAQALARPEVAALVEREEAVADAAADEALLRSNPSIGFSREHIPGDGGEAEQAVKVMQVIELSDQRALRARAAKAGRRAAALHGQARTRAIATRVRQLFYDVLHRQSRHDVARDNAGRLEEALGLVAAREAAGDASSYERQRLSGEVRRARSLLAEEEAGREAAWRRMQGWTGGEPTPWPRVSGTLGLQDAPSVRATAKSPTLEALEVEAEVARLSAKADAASRAPALSLEAGLKTTAGDERRFGYVAGASISLPIFDDGAASERRGEAQATAALARRAVGAADLNARMAGLAVHARMLAAAAARLRSDGAKAHPALIRTAEAAYAGGELGLLELLDAHDAVTQDQLRALDLERAARAAALELRALTGDPP